MMRALSPSGPQALCFPIVVSSVFTLPGGTEKWFKEDDERTVASGNVSTSGSENFEPNVTLTRAPLGLLDFHALLGGGVFEHPPF